MKFLVHTEDIALPDGGKIPINNFKGIKFQ